MIFFIEFFLDIFKRNFRFDLLFQKDFYAEEYSKCYSIPKGNDRNPAYLNKVESCFNEWRENSTIPLLKLKNMAILHKDLRVFT